VTLGFVLGSLLIGIYALGPALKGPPVPDAGRRMAMLLVAGLAFFLYTGLYVGPILAIVSALLPASLAAMVPGSGPGEGSPE
ncbi:MAG: hypothetical protein GWN18_19655, partial [Thermoplasmata archaeon]|nr:hypothetical protein [Thermoplasmata archaeon]NIS22182.1 hypothetical protein [Thermoplasmata archaeon]NIW84719.1 hypothetical protein [Thermoplasmata archaeon]